ncbi:hypothetical protein [Phytohabitans rumicis]|uniref:Uncharacterized protein n=1 Tax=Phytohabitans rumicis TaxID=1076125 RepID=A0A6V8L1A2_9ACTN|nr:hypothetical protein Prum_035560 [Phytohabitans rumicis]
MRDKEDPAGRGRSGQAGQHVAYPGKCRTGLAAGQLTGLRPDRVLHRRFQAEAPERTQDVLSVAVVGRTAGDVRLRAQGLDVRVGARRAERPGRRVRAARRRWAQIEQHGGADGDERRQRGGGSPPAASRPRQRPVRRLLQGYGHG